MFDVLFVHGTSVRGQAFDKSFATIERALKALSCIRDVYPVYWGGDHGTVLRAAGASIPRDNATESPSIDDGAEQDNGFSYERYIWDLLYQDPLIELHIVHLGKRGARNQAGLDLMDKVQELKQEPPSDLMQLLREARIDTFFDKACTIIINDRDYRNALENTAESDGPYIKAVARALIAQSVILASDNQINQNVVSLLWTPDRNSERKQFLNTCDRDAILSRLLLELGYQQVGGDEHGLINRLLSGTVQRHITNAHKLERSSLTAKLSRGAGDILMYQTTRGGQKIRDTIATEISKRSGPVVLLGHSLGGIACVDFLLLESARFPNVELLVTVGSQAPLLYELDALVGMPYSERDPKEDQLPPTFPKRWLNIYDRNDLLSYVGHPLFGDRVEDFEVVSGKLFPESHGAYWNNEAVWRRIEEALHKILPIK